MKRIYTLLVFTFLAFSSFAKDLNIAVYFNQFLNPDGETYVETYFSLDPRSVILTQNPNGSWQGGVEIVLTFSQGEQIMAFDKLSLTSPEIADSNNFIPYSVQQSRLKLAPGDYLMKIEFADMANPTEPVSLENEISIVLERDKLETSSILLLDSYKASTAESVIGKWGYELVPIVPLGTYYIEDNIKNLPFYCEIFNSDTVFGNNEPFLIKYYLYDKLREARLDKYAGFQRASGAVVNPVLNTFNIKNLPSGYYDLVVEIVDRQNSTVEKKTVSFYRKNLEADMNAFDLEQVVLENTFAQGITDLDSMYFYIDCLYPISNESERRIGKNLLNNPDIEKMQRYFLAFWNKRSPTQAKETWIFYRKQVAFVDDQFGSRNIPGYKTDMGRVYLQYGKPTTIERSQHSAHHYPWQIWQFDVLQAPEIPTQQNRIFVFVDQTLSGRSYTLIHSNAISEIQDHKWRFALQRNTNRGYNVDATSNPNSRNSYGETIDNNFIIGDHRYWYDRN